MKRAAALLVVVGVVGLGGDALADSLPIPSVPAVTVPTPPVAIPHPPVAVPKLPAPPLPAKPTAPSPAPAARVPAAPQPAVAALGASLSSGTTQSSSDSSPSSSQGSRSRSSSSPRVRHLHSSRHWIGTTGTKERRGTTLTFVLTRAGAVIFTVKQVSPSCATVGRFTVHGHAGLNRLRFAGRVAGEPLGAGSYRITARTAAGRSVQRVTVVVIDGPAPTPAELVALRSANSCASGVASAAAVRSTGASNTGVLADSEQIDGSFSGSGQPSASPAPTSGVPDAGGVLASTAEKAAQAIRPALVALLAVAIALLGLASLPRVAVPEPRLNDALVRHRLEIAGLGAAALVAVVISFLV